MPLRLSSSCNLTALQYCVSSCLCISTARLKQHRQERVSVASYILRTMDFERTETGRTLGSGRSEDELGLESDWLHQARIAREHARRRLESHAAQPAESRGPAHNSATGEFWIQTRRYLFEQEKLFDETLRTIRASDALNVGRT